jgi:hypothetical protein
VSGAESGILVVTACTAAKQPPSQTDRLYRAEDLYIGEQHRRLMQGVRAYRDAGEPAGHLELAIVSAGHGLLAADARLGPYDASFVGLPRAQMRAQARRLELPQRMADLLSKSWRAVLFLLGNDYLTACEVAPGLEVGGPGLVFCSPQWARRLAPSAGLTTVALGNREARRARCGLVGLKGELGRRFLVALGADPYLPSLMRRPELLLECSRPRTRPTSPSAATA